jgi:hypothetical protein
MASGTKENKLKLDRANGPSVGEISSTNPTVGQVHGISQCLAKIF